MSQADRTANHVGRLFHPVSHYDSPDDVLNDVALSTDEKRVILSSWASDMYVVESQPVFRKVPGIPRRIRLDDILAALRQLDGDNDPPPPRGGVAMPLPRFSRLEGVASRPQTALGGLAATRRHSPMRAVLTQGRSRWTREENIRRYRRLLNTQLTDIERSFIEQRLAEELSG